MHPDAESQETRGIINTVGLNEPRKVRRSRKTDPSHFCVRGVPPELQDELRRLASLLEVPVGEVVRALLEDGLRRYQDQELKLEPKPRFAGYTLYGVAPPGSPKNPSPGVDRR
jgi:hypothetical protein